jgi:hypothetical protein
VRGSDSLYFSLSCYSFFKKQIEHFISNLRNHTISPESMSDKERGDQAGLGWGEKPGCVGGEKGEANLQVLGAPAPLTAAQTASLLLHQSQLQMFQSAEDCKFDLSGKLIYSERQ